MKHSHYFKDVSSLTHIDVYRVLQLFGVTDPCLQHAAKKLLVAGGRGAKDIEQDVQEAIDTLTRWKDMRIEEKTQQQAAAQARDGKPAWKDAPKWAMWSAKDCDGCWWWFDERPIKSQNSWLSKPGGQAAYVFRAAAGNWESSLEARP